MKAKLLIILAFSIASCEFLEKNFSTQTKTPVYEDGGIRSFHPNGKLASVCYVDEEEKKHGKCTSYYEDGYPKNQITYDHGEKIKGVSFYKGSTNPALEISYANGMKDGIRKRYFEDGTLASQFEYKENKPGKGLVEYKKSGEKLTYYPKLIIRSIDKLQTHGQFILEIYFEKNANRGEYYVGELEDGKFLITSPDLGKLTTYNGKARYVFNIPA